MNHKLSIIIVTYNSTKYLPDFLESIFEQNYYQESGETPDIFVIDNASRDETIKMIKDHYPMVKLLRNINNIGLCRAWNQGIKMSQGEFVLIMNPDLIMDKDFIKHTILTMESDNNIACVGGKLRRLKVEMDGDLSPEYSGLEKTNILDNCGIQAFKNRRFIDRGAGELDKGQYDKQEEVFGISGALVLYRREALEQVKFEQEYFDEKFFMYQEDIDMAWRLRLAGWNIIYNPQAIAYHHRRAKSQGNKVKNFTTIKQRRTKENFVNSYSYRNHWLLLYKNILYKNFIQHLPWIFFYELRKFIYVLVLENSTLRKTLMDFWRLKKIMRKKRILNMQLKKIRTEEIRHWFE